AGAAIPPAGHRARHTALLLRPTPHARVDAAETGWRVLEHGGGTDPFASARTRLEGTRAAWPDAHPGIRQLRRRQRQGPLVALRTCTGGNCGWTRCRSLGGRSGGGRGDLRPGCIASAVRNAL